MRARRSYCLGLTLLVLTAGARADEVQWRPAGAPAEAAPAPFVTLRCPEPLPLAEADPGAAPAFRLRGPIVRCQAASPPAPGAPVPVVPPPPPPPLPPGGVLASPEDAYNCGVATGPATAHPLLTGGQGFWERCTGAVGQVARPCDGRACLQSDHAFDTFISPVTNPFYFEDPRSLTEVRTILIYQRTPDSAPFFAGGSIEYVGVQARLALTERLSFVLSELGYLWINPHAPADGFARAQGFSEVHLGPQYTFVRNEQTGTLFAGGLQFEIPSGPDRVFQDTGTLSVTPYFSFGQAFGENPYGRFHFLNTTGYSFAVDRERTDRFFDSFHLDFDILNAHHFYPLVELNWFIYPTGEIARALSVEGRDLIDFGADDVGGKNELDLAFGLRYKCCEAVQFGAAVELPLLDNKELINWRLTFDVIFRY